MMLTEVLRDACAATQRKYASRRARLAISVGSSDSFDSPTNKIDCRKLRLNTSGRFPSGFQPKPLMGPRAFQTVRARLLTSPLSQRRHAPDSSCHVGFACLYCRHIHMRISRIKIQNFRSIQTLDLELPQVCAVIGPNNAGKSNLLEAIFRVLGKQWLQVRDFDEDDVYSRNPGLSVTKSFRVCFATWSVSCS